MRKWLVACVLAASCGGQSWGPRAGNVVSGTESARSIDIDLQALEDEARGATLLLALDSRVTVVARRTRIDRRGAGDFSWFGSIDGDGDAVIAAKNGRLWGTIVYAGQVYQLTSGTDDRVHLAAVEPAAEPPVHPAHRRSVAPWRPPPPVLPQDGPIRVLVAYTHEVWRACADVELLSQNSFDLLTVITNNSKAAVSFQLARIEAMDATENQSTSMEETLSWFARQGDNHYDTIHRLRDQYEADVSVLVVNIANARGLTTRTMAHKDEAFSVVDWRYATTTFTLAHEIGHQMGLNDDEDIPSAVTFPYGFGYVHESSIADQSWRTVMANQASCSHYRCRRIPRWSNADASVTYRGAPTGDRDHDSVRVLAATGGFVSRFR